MIKTLSFLNGVHPSKEWALVTAYQVTLIRSNITVSNKKSYLMCNTPKILGSPNTSIQSPLPTLKTTQVQSAVWVKEAGLELAPNHYLHDGSDDAEPRPGTSGNGIVRTCAADRHFGLEGGHALRHPGCQGELFPQLNVGPALGWKLRGKVQN